jgi:hypothetical protein
MNETADKTTYIRDGFTYRVTTCYLCGTRSEHMCCDWGLGVPSWELDGTPDWYWAGFELCQFELCPSCGYIARDISEGDERIRAVVNSDTYQAEFKDPQRPSRMQLGALLVDPRDEYYLETRCCWYLWGAWSSESGEGLVPSRRLAAAALGKVIEAGRRYHRAAGMDFVVVADLHRRCGEFDEAADWVGRGLACDCDEKVQRELALEKAFIERRDTGPHGAWEVPGQPSEVAPPPTADGDSMDDGDLPF